MEHLMIDDIHHRSFLFEIFKYLHIKRVENCIVDFVARLRPSIGDEYVWIDNVPQSVVALGDLDLIN